MPADDIDRAASAIKAGARGRCLLLLLDFDGTLVEFNPDPEAVVLPDERRRLLLAIQKRHDATVAIISGRRLADVRERARLPPDNYHAGLHGLEIEGRGEKFEHPDARKAKNVVQELVAGLSADLRDVPGTLVEDKVLSLVIHFRAAPPAAAERIPGVLAGRAQRYIDTGQLRIMDGAGMTELLPNIPWNKGHAVGWIRERVVSRSKLPVVCVFVGDDVTDQDAFRALGNGGIAVAASNRVSGADFYIDGPREVEALLQQLALP